MTSFNSRPHAISFGVASLLAVLLLVSSVDGWWLQRRRTRIDLFFSPQLCSSQPVPPPTPFTPPNDSISDTIWNDNRIHLAFNDTVAFRAKCTPGGTFGTLCEFDASTMTIGQCWSWDLDRVHWWDDGEWNQAKDMEFRKRAFGQQDGQRRKDIIVGVNHPNGGGDANANGNGDGNSADGEDGLHFSITPIQHGRPLTCLNINITINGTEYNSLHVICHRMSEDCHGHDEDDEMTGGNDSNDNDQTIGSNDNNGDDNNDGTHPHNTTIWNNTGVFKMSGSAATTLQTSILMNAFLSILVAFMIFYFME